jgi:YVTN family beta-propeller protein
MFVGGALIGAAAVALASPDSQLQTPLRAAATIQLPNVSGRIDHLAFDPVRQRLFVAALGNDTVEVIDTAHRQRVASLTGFHEPQGIAVVPDLGVAIANGGSGTLALVDGSTLKTRWTVAVAEDADNVRYDAHAKRLLVAGVGGIFSVDPASGRLIGRIAIAGHPESFQLEANGTRVFANLPGSDRIIAGDRPSMAVRAQWPAGECGSNYPMAMPEKADRLFIGCRKPPAVAIVDTTTGKILGTTPTVGDTDDLFYDAARDRLYVVGGEGAVDVLTAGTDRLRRLARIPTRDGARTGLWVPSQDRLYVAVPARNGAPAEVRGFDAP